MRTFPYIVLFTAIGAAAAIPLWPEPAPAAPTAPSPSLSEMRETITYLKMVDEFKGPERARLEALPMEYVPALTRELAGEPLYEPSRLFLLLATKVAQYESALPRDQLDAAVEALLARLAPYLGLTDDGAVDLRLRARWANGIQDPRVTAAVERTQAALKARPAGPVVPPEIRRAIDLLPGAGWADAERLAGEREALTTAFPDMILRNPPLADQLVDGISGSDLMMQSVSRGLTTAADRGADCRDLLPRFFEKVLASADPADLPDRLRLWEKRDTMLLNLARRIARTAERRDLTSGEMVELAHEPGAWFRRVYPPEGRGPFPGAWLTREQTAYLAHTDSVPAPRLAVEEDAILTFDLDATGDGTPERFYSLRSFRDGKMGYVWSVYTHGEPDGGLKLLGEVTAPTGALAAAAWRKDQATRGVYTFSPGGAGKGTLCFYQVDSGGIRRLEEREIEPGNTDEAEYDSIFEGSGAGDAPGITPRETPLPKKPATAPAPDGAATPAPGTPADH